MHAGAGNNQLIWSIEHVMPNNQCMHVTSLWHRWSTQRDAATPTMVRLERVGVEADGVPWWL
jgi:hypothetical protein